jgi:hypothetical protein
MPDWDSLPSDVREDIRQTARKLLTDITTQRVTAAFSENEFEFLERGANAEPIVLTLPRRG